jgi:oxaloacetate decarboxylase beta subunit
MGFFYIDWRMLVMWCVVAVLLYLAVKKNFEPLLLVPIAFGALLANLPTRGLVNHPVEPLASPTTGTVIAVFAEPQQDVTFERVHLHRPEFIRQGITEDNVQWAADQAGLMAVVRPDDIVQDAITTYEVTVQGRTVQVQTGDYYVWADGDGWVTEVYMPEGSHVVRGEEVVGMAGLGEGGLYYYFYKGIALEIFPPLIFLGVGALTDFGPLIANPITLLLGGAAQIGIFITFLSAVAMGFTSLEAASIGIIGGADGPTSIFVTNKLAPHLLAPIAVAAYSYMSLVPVIQPPIMRLLTSVTERKIRMKSLRKVGRTEKLVFALLVAILCILVVPDAAALIGMLMFGNFLRENGQTERLVKAAQNEIINIVTIFLGSSVGITMTADRFLNWETIKILSMGIVAFDFATAGGVLMAKFFNLFLKNKINPLIGSAGVSAVPMAARVSQVEGQKADPGNFLLYHAMGPNVAGVIGTAVAAGFFIATLR